MQMLMGRWVAHGIGLAAKLGLADQLAAGPRRVDELATALGANAGALHRVMRMLASVGIFAEVEPGLFGNTPMSDTLRDGPGSNRAMAMFLTHPTHVEAWLELEHCVMTGGSGFVKAHGESPWERLPKDPELATLFNTAMTSFSAQEAPMVAAAYDFSRFDTLADVGGGHGLLLATILAANPALHGILFDLPQAVAGAKPTLEAKGVVGRTEVVGGDFFIGVPAADAYILKHIIHDWSDADSVKILQTIHRAAKPGAKLLLAEMIVQPGNAPDVAKVLDIEMLVVTTGGKERTQADFAALYDAAGWKLERVVTTHGPIALIEGTRL